MVLQRKGQYYTRFDVTQGAATANAYLGTKVKYPTGLAEAANGRGFSVNFASTFLGATGLAVAGFAEQRQLIGSNQSYNLADWIPSIDTQSTIVVDERSSVEWTLPSSGNHKLAAAIVSWDDPLAPGTFRQWLAVAPHDFGAMQLPQLPASMSRYIPPTSGTFQGSITMLINPSWVSTYQDMVKTQGVLDVLRTGLGGAGTYGDISGAASVKFVLSFPSLTTPSASGSASARKTTLGVPNGPIADSLPMLQSMRSAQ
jgi:hypothetical protein